MQSPKTLVIGTDEKQSILDCQKPRSKLKQLLNVLGCLTSADIHGSRSIGNIGLEPDLSCANHRRPVRAVCEDKHKGRKAEFRCKSRESLLCTMHFLSWVLSSKSKKGEHP